MSERKLLFLMTAEQADAFARLLGAAERGDGDAACRLGDMYREGLGGLRYSPKETYRWYAKSALAGDANGQNNLGACYEHGLGCAQSYAKAVKWYRLSAAQGLGTAAMNLGYCYLRGHGVGADKEEALRLFREAVERGEERAAHEVEKLELEMGPRVSEPVAAGTPHRPDGQALERLLSVTRDTVGGEETPQPSNVRWRRGIRFVDETHHGQHLGLIGVSGMRPPSSAAGDADLNSSAIVSAQRAGAGGPLEDRLEAGTAESEPPGKGLRRVRRRTLRHPRTALAGGTQATGDGQQTTMDGERPTGREV